MRPDDRASGETPETEPRWRRTLRRVIVGALLAAGGLTLASQPAGAAVRASFNGGVLTVFGDADPDTITVSRDAAGSILVNGGSVAVVGAQPTVANTSLIQVFALGGSDIVTLDESNGALPAGSLFGGTEADTLVGGSGSDQLFGQGGSDTLDGRGGADILSGGAGNDGLTGGDADDQVFGEGGDDVIIWNPGDDTDLNEGGPGFDIVGVIGGGGSESFTATANGTRVRFDRIAPAPFALDIGTSELLLLAAGGGDDTFSATGNLAPLIELGINGGDGNDTILGGNGADWLLGEDGDDLIDGQQGNDMISLGAGDDVAQWDPGDGSDSVEGEAGLDRMLFNGSAGSEIFDASANGGRLRFTRSIGTIVMDADDVEVLDVNALGGTDTLTVGDLTATDVDSVEADLAGTLGGAAGDGVADTVIVTGTDGDDAVDITGSGTAASVTGLAAQVSLANADGADDALVLTTLGGADTVTATGLPAGIIRLTVDGGSGDDRVRGSQGADVLLGGGDDDTVVGGARDDVVLLGGGDDVFQWDPGDGNDTIEGQAGQDRMLFVGSGASENVDVVANGGRVLFVRNVAAVAIDLDDVEAIGFLALGGADNVTVGDLTGTDLTAVKTDLTGSGGGGDGSPDTVTVDGTNGADSFGATGDTVGVDVVGLHAAVAVTAPEPGDHLTLNGRAGADGVDASSLAADTIQLTINAGLGDDTVLGSPGDDVVTGGDGNDTALMGGGDDTFLWSPGDDNDTLEGQVGRDTMLFNGANVAETIDIAANGDRVRFFRNVASVTMDLDGVEIIDFNALGGADTVVIGDLEGTDVVEVNTDLAAAAGGGDGQPDNVIVQGTEEDDIAIVVGDTDGATVLGFSALVHVTGSEVANDRLTINALGGSDVIDASGLDAGVISLTEDGGDGDDVLIGSDGDDVLLGGDGDDVLIGGAGLDVIDGGAGDDVEIQSIVGPAAPAAPPERVTSARTADERWLVDHLSIVDGKTVVTVGGGRVTLPHADLAPLLEAATSTARPAG